MTDYLTEALHFQDELTSQLIDQGKSMKTKTFDFYLYQTPYGTLDDPAFSLTDSVGMEEHGYVLIRPVPVTVELPEPHDARKIKLHALELRERDARAKFSALITELQRQKQELLAIEMAA